ncbi:MAG: GTP 3',8-cyclase MoaA [Pseudomonadota bacterium]
MTNPKGLNHPTDRLDRPIRDLRISLIDRCNYRCPYCMPISEFGDDYEFLKRDARLSHKEIVRMATIMVGLGVTKLRLTGGEPLLDKNIVSLIERLATIPGVDDLAITTNGQLLAPKAQALRDAGLKRITLSLDSVNPDRFAQMSGGRGDLDSVLAGVAGAELAGFSLKINTVVQRGVNDDGVLDVLEYFRGTSHVVRLIEYMDVGNRNGWQREHVVPSSELLGHINARWPVESLQPNYWGEVARRYRYSDGGGEIGFISSVTAPFCGSCHRARLAADGTLYTCLFATQGTRFLEPLRWGASDEEIGNMIRRVWLRREDRYSEQRAMSEQPLLPKVEMHRVGG